MTQDLQVLRKSIALDPLISLLPQAEDIRYWQNLNPNSRISNQPFEGPTSPPQVSPPQLEEFVSQLREDGYFQTEPLIPPATLAEMRTCIETVKQAGFPAMFALVYDIFYQVMGHFEAIVAEMLGPGYKIVPNYWIYYIDPEDSGKGFEPHRDAEYENTIDSTGMPTVLTLWIAITDANPLNSCMYILPANRDPQYRQAITNLKTEATEFKLEDIRALPTAAGTLSCWDQYVFHWGSRSSKRAKFPRLSLALYCQRGDIPPVEDILIDIPSTLDFKTRLGIICRGLYRYSYLSLKECPEAQPLLTFLESYQVILKTN
ncbi:phytanoyl-CoA dioxygenase family protein [Oscillatoria acuminata]|uniref:Protein involved in biosynthesis of mitomycin antibiotics/polyketide fumonisin n=1 Tax=Oscillatoria acuminata PCC 6304 TaxID=56110 RepID=K9TGN4_9CYAN|nr:phytanoyl-CoA dioxygenase family protein [Oscillatoria acuminata]AFY81563.1 protein involved in biosynthesis of mitomycin antibiotics/polyketide fumonisin [Oscillatoria acuminata PCC 6304]